MNADSIAQLESEFGIRLPAEYRDTLLAYPFACDFEELTADATALSDFNRGCRAEHTWGFKWETHHWWIGGDGAGGLYFINCNDDVCRVYYLDHEDPAKTFADQTRLAPQLLSECVRSIKQLEADLERERERTLKRIAQRRWWQFWIPRSPPAWAPKPDDRN